MADFQTVITNLLAQARSIDLAEFAGFSISQIWKKIDELLGKFGYQLYVESSLVDKTPAFTEFELFLAKRGHETLLFGIRNLETDEITMFGDKSHDIGDGVEAKTKTKQALLWFYERISALNDYDFLKQNSFGMSFTEFCSACGGEVELAYKGFVSYKCPDCGNELLPCSLCDAYTDNPVMVSGCKNCPFSCSAVLEKGA